MNLLQALYAVNDFLDQGGTALYVIFFMAIVLWALIIERFLYLCLFSRKEQRRLLTEWQAYRDHTDAGRIRECLQVDFREKLMTGFAFIKVLITIAPLLGLYGTVYGMIEIFDVIAQSGTGDARAMASGISVATLSTMSGMAVAITGLIFRHQIENMIQRKTGVFNEQLDRQPQCCIKNETNSKR
ncbi:MAG: biopolymer transporter ExbB [Proteobacteria bacterium]|nr:MAG: biopolymer transporter ExbB [Pseudomonadota bacterium]